MFEGTHKYKVPASLPETAAAATAVLERDGEIQIEGEA